MANPENNHNLPTPENPNNGLSIDIKNVAGIYEMLRDRNYPHSVDGGYSDNNWLGVNLGSLKIGDNLVRDVKFLTIGKNNKNPYLPQFYQLVFDIHRQTKIGNSQSYQDPFDEDKRYLSKTKVQKIMDELVKTGESPVYCVDDDGHQNIKIKKNGVIYVVSCGFIDLQHHWDWYINDYDKRDHRYLGAQLSPQIDPFRDEINFKKTASNSSINIYIGNENIESRIVVGHNFLLPNEEIFTRSFEDFSKVCKLVVDCIYRSNDEPLPNKTLILDLPKIEPEKNISTITRSENLEAKTSDYRHNIVAFSDIAGQVRAVAEAKKLVLAINHPEVYEKRGVKTPKGILFYGPPGTGKTLIAKAIASEIDAELFEVSFSDIGSKWYGESEQRIQEVFDNANKVTRTGKKVIILFDELDSMAPSRNDAYEGSKKIVSIILQNLDGFRSNKDVLIVGTTNRPEDIDPALKRPGRIDKIIAVDLPDLEDRKAILQLHINKAIERSTESHDLFSSDLDIQKIAESTKGMSGADLANIINLTLESKTVLELEGLRWTPVSDADIEKTLIDFNLKKEEKKRIGFN